MCLIDPEKVEELTEQEKFECTVRWLNDLYDGYRNMLHGWIDGTVFLEKVGTSCNECPHNKKCPSTARDPYRPTIPIPHNFQVLSQFTPGLNVVGPVLQRWDIPHKDNVFQNE